MFLPQPITFNMFLPVGGTLGLVIQLVNRSRNNLDNLKMHNHPVLSVVFDIINKASLSFGRTSAGIAWCFLGGFVPISTHFMCAYKLEYVF